MARRVAVWFFGAVAILACGVAQIGWSASLCRRSPFLSEHAVVQTPPTAAPLEFHGFMQTEEGIRFWVRDPALRRGAFVKLNEAEPELNVVVRSHDPEKATLTVERAGQTYVLPERTAKVRSMAQRMMEALPRANQTVPTRVIEAVRPNPTPAQEKERLDIIVAEINRRRQLREQESGVTKGNAAVDSQPR